MKKPFDLTRVTLWTTRAVALVLTVLLFTMPAILEWYSHVRALTELEKTAILAAFYACAVLVYIALFQMDRLLRMLLEGQVFLRQNVKKIRIIQWCCGGIGLICVPAAIAYYPLCFMVVIMGFLCLVISVLCRVMDEAVTIREENDLTI